MADNRRIRQRSPVSVRARKPPTTSTAEPGLTATPADDWSRQTFYRTMLWIFLHRGKLPEPPENYAPFFQQEPSRRLTEGQYTGSRDLYVGARCLEFQFRGGRRARGAWLEGGRWEVRQPHHLPGEPEHILTEAQIALGRLFYATTKSAQRQARAQVRTHATKGRVAARKMLRAALTATPQAKARFSREELLFEVLPYRAQRQFLWHFVTAELRFAVRRKAAADRVPWTFRDLRENPNDFTDEVTALLCAYPFLGLSRAGLMAGLSRDHPADADTAHHFGLSAATLRSLFSKEFGPRPA
jgi:hypothetical protein